MTRQQRRAINRANSQASTGPSTSEGKAVSSRNATKHGLTAFSPFLPHEELAFSEFAADHLRRFNPQNSTERELVDTIRDTKWRLQRIPSLEARLFADPEADASKVIRSLDILSRHEMRLRKLLDAAIQAYANVVSLRAKQKNQSQLASQSGQNGFVLQNGKPACPVDTRQPRNLTSEAAKNLDLVAQAIESAATSEEADTVIEAFLNEGGSPGPCRLKSR
ncbi:MAG: hypothetical protein ABI823_05910 [Bryobacteraceae bacterium]